MTQGETAESYPYGQLCPYGDCCHDLALPCAGWYVCGHCQREFWCRVSDSDYEDYACYLPGEREKWAPPRPKLIPVAQDLGPSWGSPEAEPA